MRAISYSRFSTDRQTDASIQDQQRVCREFAAARGWLLVAEHADEGISGAALGNRPGVQAALTQLAHGDVLLLADLTRLSRSQDLAPMIERLRFRGVRVVGVLDGYDSTSPQARMQAGLSGLMSDELRANIRVRTHSALEMRAKAGSKTGGKVYGFTTAGEILEGEAVVVREIFARAAAAETLRAIASDLNARGVPSPGASWKREERRVDGRWLVSAVHAMLRNERYIGRVVWNRSVWVKDPDTGKRIRRERPESEWVVRDGAQLVDLRTWELVQARMQERASVYGGARGGHPQYMLSGVLVCEACGGKLVACGKRGAHYYCGTHRHGGPAACEVSVGARRDVAEDLIVGRLYDALLSPAAEARAAELIAGWFREERTAAASGEDPAVVALNAEIAQLEALIEAHPALASTLRDAAEGLRDRRAALTRAAWRKASSSAVPAVDAAVAAYREAVANMRELLAGDGGSQQTREAVRSLLGGEVKVAPEQGGRFLVAQVGYDMVPLMRRAGVVSWIGSGGLLWTREMSPVELRRRQA